MMRGTLENLKTSFAFSGQGIIINKENTIGILVRSYLKNDIHNIELITKGIIDGSLESFNKNTISIGKELALSLGLIVLPLGLLLNYNKVDFEKYVIETRELTKKTEQEEKKEEWFN